MKDEIVTFEDFTVKLTKDHIMLYENKKDDFGNKFVSKVTNIDLDPKALRSSYGQAEIFREVLLELIRLEAENKHLKFHLNVKGEIE